MLEANGRNWNIIHVSVLVICLLIIGFWIFIYVNGNTVRDGGGSIRSGTTMRQMTNNTQTRGIVQSLIMQAENNKGYYVGLTSKGEVIDTSVEYRFWVMLDENYYDGKYCINPMETKQVWTTGAVTRDNYSYALLQLEGDLGQKLKAGRGDEWQVTGNAAAPIISDRNLGISGYDHHVQSIHTECRGTWRGSVATNDGSGEFMKTHKLHTGYGTARPERDEDNLFQREATDDAYLIYHGSQ